MKYFQAALCFLASTTLYAQNYPEGISQQDMQAMMQAMQQVQQCMSKIDQAELDAMEARSNQMIAEVEALCKNNKRSQAQDKALSHAKEIASSEVIKDMQKCTEPVKGMMQGMVETFNPELSVEELKQRHVCDGI